MEQNGGDGWRPNRRVGGGSHPWDLGKRGAEWTKMEVEAQGNGLLNEQED